MSGLHQVKVDSGLVTVLSLGLLAKVSEPTEASFRLPRSPRPYDLFKKVCSMGWGWFLATENARMHASQDQFLLLKEPATVCQEGLIAGLLKSAFSST